MPDENNAASRERRCHELSTAKHYRNLLHFARLMLQGNLVEKEHNRYALVQEHYARVINDEICDFMSLEHKRILDVGGNVGGFCRVFSEEFGAALAVNLEPFHGYDKERHWAGRVRGVAQFIPFRDSQFDFVMCRQVLEHMPPEYLQGALDEMYRVTREGGLCYIAIPPWYNPVSGHALMPFHYLPFRVARRLALFFFKNPPINPRATSYAELPLFKTTYKQAMSLISASGFSVLATKDHHFRLHFLTRIPLVRDVAVPCLVFLLRK